MENNNNLQDKLGEKAQELKQDFHNAKERIGDKANEWKNDIKEKKDEIVNKVKGSNESKSYGSSCGCNKQNGTQGKEECKQPKPGQSQHPGTEHKQ